MRALRLDRYTVANILLWIGSFLSLTARMMFDPMAWELTGRRVAVTFSGFVICQLSLPLFRRMRRAPLPLQGLAGVLFAVVASVLYGFANHIIMYSFRPLRDAPSYSDVLFLAVLQIFVFFAWAALAVALGVADEAQEQSMRLLSAEKLAAESQADMLRYQLNPHFLFNTLNALSALILQKENATAEKLVLALSGFLRHALKRRTTDLIPLREELAAQREYLTIERIRFAERLIFEDKVPEALLDTPVPSLILQPLVENAVKYGVAPSTQPVTICIEAERTPEGVAITVNDDGAFAELSEAPRLGVGLQNVRSRLSLAYPKGGRLVVAPRRPAGFAARIELPLEAGP